MWGVYTVIMNNESGQRYGRVLIGVVPRTCGVFGFGVAFVSAVGR